MNDSVSELDTFFSDLSPEEREKILAGESIWTKQSFPKGTVIFEEGSATSDLYIILKGSVEIVKRVGDQGDHQKCLAILQKGSIFGEGALLSQQPRYATVRAVKDVEVLVLSQAQFQTFLQTHREAAFTLILSILKVVNQRLISTNYELVTLYEISQLVTQSKGDLRNLSSRIAKKLEAVTHATQGVLALKNPLTTREEIFAQWGDLNLTPEQLQLFEQELGTQRFSAQEGRLTIGIRDLSGKFWGTLVMQKEGEWPSESVKLALAIAEQLGMAIAEYRFMEMEAGRSRLEQRNIAF